MRLNLQAKTTGYLWMKDAVVLFKKTPKFYTAITVAAYLFIILLPTFLGELGHFIGIMAGVICSATIMLAAHMLKNDEVSHLTPFAIDPFRLVCKNKNIWFLAFLYAVCFFALHYAMLFLFQVALPHVYENYASYKAAISSLKPNMVEDELLKAHIYVRSINFFLLAPHVLLIGFFCMTPALVYWGNLNPIKATVFNVVACMKNWQAWFMYILGWTAIFISIFIALLILYTLLFLLFGETGIALGIMLTAVFTLVFLAISSAILSISLYFAYQNSFVTKQSN